jgi:hypothetical protein
MSARSEPEKLPDGNKQKFAWIYAMAADTKLSDSAKLVGTMSALKLAGRKGHLKATHKALANLCGMSHRTVQRAVAELDRENYWNIDARSGGANEYFIIHPDERVEEWDYAAADYRRAYQAWVNAESNYKRRCDKWLDAEQEFEQRRYAQKWLDAESDAKTAYTIAVFRACLDRGASYEHGVDIAEHAWADHQLGRLPIEAALATIRDARQDVLTPPEAATPDDAPLPDLARPPTTSGETPYHQWRDPLPDLARPLANPDAPTSANDHSHKSFKSLKTYKDSKGEHALRAALDARAPHGPLKQEPGCRLCGPDGTFLDPDDYPVVLLNDEDDDEYQMECQHSMAGNLAEIRRIESESEGFWGIARTGYREIDSQYGYLDDPYPSDTDPWEEEE